MTRALAHDRRRSPRRTANDLPPGMSISLRAGHDAQAVNVSRHGILLDSLTRLNPGQRCCLHWRGLSVPASSDGVVVRAEVARSDRQQRLVYRAAIEFSEPRDPAWEVVTHTGNALLAPVEVSHRPAGNTCPDATRPSRERPGAGCERA